MPNYVFTVTQDISNFTATIAYPVNLTFNETPDQVQVANVVSTVTVINSVQPITISGAGGQTFNQSLNTTNHVAFASVTTPTIYGPAQQPVFFPTGISVQNVGTVFSGTIDQGAIYNTFTNQLSLLFALVPLNFGGITNPATISINFGSV